MASAVRATFPGTRIDGGSSRTGSEYLPVHLEMGLTQVVVKRDESILDQLRGDRVREPIRIYAEMKDNKTVISVGQSNGIPLYTPVEIPAKMDKLRGEVHAGGFTILSNPKKELLFVLKKQGNFWSIPGGLIEKGKDKTLWDAAKRELEEETGAIAQGQDLQPVFAYESFIPLREPTRHNLMFFFSETYNGETLPIVQDEDIQKCAWIKPALFWSSYLKETKFSSPMIRFPLDEFRKTEMKKFRLGENYEKLKASLASGYDELLFDLCFIEGWDQARALPDLINDALELAKLDRIYKG